MDREDLTILAVGDNVVDKYLSRGKMYPGGQCVNTCVYAQENGIRAAYLGVCGEGVEAQLIEDTLNTKGIEHGRCRYIPGEGGFALVTLRDGDRVFLGSNKGGVARTHLLELTQEDLAYAQGFSLVYSNCNGFADRELPKLKAAGIPIAFDFSDRWTPDYLQATLPWVDIALLSCSHLPAGQREEVLAQALHLGARIAVATAGQEGSWVLWEGKLFHAPAARAAQVVDTMGAGDAYFAAFLCSLLKTAGEEGLFARDLSHRIPQAMGQAAAYAAQTCALEGAFGGGVTLAGRTELTPLEKDLSL